MSEWPMVAFETVLSEPVRNGIYKPKEFHGRGSKIVNMGELFGHPRLRAVPMKRVQLTPSELTRFSLLEGDLIFARRSLTAEGAGKCSIVLELDDSTTFESSIIRARPDPRSVSSLFLYYFFNSPVGFHRLDTIRRQVAVAGITGTDLSRLTIPLPRIMEQRAIADLLGSLDDKIDLNRSMNETLEAMARAIFKDWFVDFGPTRAKMEGRAPYLAPDIWRLFPARLDDGGRPVGWGFVKLGDLCARVAMGPFGSDITTDNFVDHGVPIIRGGNLRRGFIDDGFVYVTEEKADSLKNANAFPEDIVITHRGTLGQVGIIPKTPNHPRYVVSQSQMLLSANPHRASPRFIFEFLRSERGMQQLLAFTSQVGVPAISRPTTSLKVLEVVAPSSEILVHFDNLLAPLVDREIANISETRRLTDLRDLLLPKLMSGEVLLRDAEKIAGAAA
jgi:type I restriction enzyme, S subunit